jgi:hypothetical protein
MNSQEPRSAAACASGLIWLACSGKGSRSASAVGDAAGGDHRHADGVHHLRHQREGADLALAPGWRKGAAMAAGLPALGDHGVDAARFQPPHRRGRSSSG